MVICGRSSKSQIVVRLMNTIHRARLVQPSLVVVRGLFPIGTFELMRLERLSVADPLETKDVV